MHQKYIIYVYIIGMTAKIITVLYIFVILVLILALEIKQIYMQRH